MESAKFQAFADQVDKNSADTEWNSTASATINETIRQRENGLIGYKKASKSIYSLIKDYQSKFKDTPQGKPLLSEKIRGIKPHEIYVAGNLRILKDHAIDIKSKGSQTPPQQ